MLRRVEDARRYAQLCLKTSQAPGLPDFCLGYAYEAAARAEMIAGDTAQMRIHIEDAHQVAARMTDAEAQKMLLDDLATIQ